MRVGCRQRLMTARVRGIVNRLNTSVGISGICSQCCDKRCRPDQSNQCITCAYKFFKRKRTYTERFREGIDVRSRCRVDPSVKTGSHSVCCSTCGRSTQRYTVASLSSRYIKYFEPGCRDSSSKCIDTDARAGAGVCI